MSDTGVPVRGSGSACCGGQQQCPDCKQSGRITIVCRLHDGTVRREIAKAIHDRRCCPLSEYTSVDRYFECLRYYDDHAQAALDHLLEAGWTPRRSQ